jgi:hypothetical protein
MQRFVGEVVDEVRKKKFHAKILAYASEDHVQWGMFAR